MRTIIYLICLCLVVGVAYWAYTENYTTQASSRRVQDLRIQISQEQEALSVLKAEWAYLTRPERLENLVDLNFDRLQLVPMAAQHYARLQDIPMPFDAAASLVDTIEVSNRDPNASEVVE